MSREQGGFGRLLRLLLPHLCLVLSLVLYSVLGAAMFLHLEASAHNTSTRQQGVLEELWTASSANMSRGYGRMAPVTELGRVATMVYAAVGIPLMLLLLADLGDILAVCMSRTYNVVLDAWHRCFPRGSSRLQLLPERSTSSSSADSRVSIKEPLNLTDILRSQAPVKDSFQQLRNIRIFELLILKDPEMILPRKGPFMRCYSCPELKVQPSAHSALLNFDNLGAELEQLDVPIVVILLVVMAFIMLGALILPQWEKWTTLEAFYFCFITLTTIGFGDVFPAHPKFFLLLSVYTVLGMAIICMAFKLMQNRMVCLYKRCVTCVTPGEVNGTPGDKP
ncbi:potassium channel subfamily K member 18 isoform 2-T2 [Anomaloglossus baeobatrachus]|uniref:potassium channel subfamily K member 18 isoform X2 n=1 Tax=Anomaloglossus baeobatrachus TaxID=238106 RepID=UPI003F503941